MSILFGTNTTMSTWRYATPLMCNEEPHQLSENIATVIKAAREKGIISDENNYSKFVTLFNSMDEYVHIPVTVFAFTNDYFDQYFPKVSDYDKHRIAKSHLLRGLLTEDLIIDKITRLSPLSRSKFHITNDKIFNFVNREPTVISNILGQMYDNKQDRVLVYFINSPIFTLDQIYNDDSA